METFDFPDSLLETAAKITLKDLLDAPFSQPWLVSALSNATHFSHQVEDATEQDLLLAARLERIIRNIPAEEKGHLYQQCSRMVQGRKARRLQPLDLRIVRKKSN